MDATAGRGKDNRVAALNDSAQKTISIGPVLTGMVGDLKLLSLRGRSARPNSFMVWEPPGDACQGFALLIKDETCQNPELNLEMNPPLPRSLFLKELVEDMLVFLVYRTKIHRSDNICILWESWKLLYLLLVLLNQCSK